jgi:GNAT superfamily N-acetyltransferase
MPSEPGATIVIREAHGEQDIAAIRQLMLDYGSFLADGPSGSASICLTGYEQELDGLPNGYATILLAEVDGAPAGCVALREIPRPERACEMKRLWVGSSFRGHRLGRLLVERALDWATRHGFESMYLDTVPAAMPEANRLYASLGFAPVERYNQNSVADVEFFAKPLNNVR